MSDSSVKSVVYQCLDNAVANNYRDVAYESPVDEVAVDLANRSAELEDVSLARLERYIRQWRKERIH